MAKIQPDLLNALVILGAVCSGKSTLAKNLSQVISFDLISEENFGNYFQIQKEIDNQKHPKAIFEHCDLVKDLVKISKEYCHVLILFLNISDKILRDNYQNRLSSGVIGDFCKIDPIVQQNELMIEYNKQKKLLNNKKVKFQIFNIQTIDDYSQLLEKVCKLLY